MQTTLLSFKKSSFCNMKIALFFGLKIRLNTMILYLKKRLIEKLQFSSIFSVFKLHIHFHTFLKISQNGWFTWKS